MATLRSATWGRDQPLTLRGGKCVAVSTTQTGSTARSVSPCSTTSRGLEPQRAVPMNAHVSQHSGINRERGGVIEFCEQSTICSNEEKKGWVKNIMIYQYFWKTCWNEKKGGGVKIILVCIIIFKWGHAMLFIIHSKAF